MECGRVNEVRCWEIANVEVWWNGLALECKGDIMGGGRSEWGRMSCAHTNSIPDFGCG